MVIGAGRRRAGRRGPAGRRRAPGDRATSAPTWSAASSAGTRPRTAFRFDTGPSLLTLPQVFARPVRHRDLRPRRCRSTRSCGTSSPTARCSTRAATRTSFAARIAAAFGAGGRRRLARGCGGGPRGSGTPPGGTCCTAPVDSPLRWPRLAWRLRRPGRDRARAARCAALGRRTCATRGCGCCSTGTPPTPAPTRAGPRPRWPRSRTPSWPSAAGTCRGGLGTLADALLARCAGARRASCRPGTAVTGIDAGRRPGARGTARRRRRAVPADVVVANADALHVYRDLLPTPRAAGPAGRPQPRRLRAAARACAARPRRWPTTPCSSRADYDAEFDAVFGDPGAASGPAGARPDRLRHRRPTTRRSARPGTRRGSCWSTRPRTAPRPARSTGAGPGWPTAYADRVLDVLAARGAGRARPAAVPRGPHPGRPGAADRRAGRRDLRHGRTAAACCARPTAARSHGLFLVGGSVHPGGGLPMVTLSAADRRRPDRPGLTPARSAATRCGAPAAADDRGSGRQRRARRTAASSWTRPTGQQHPHRRATVTVPAGQVRLDAARPTPASSSPTSGHRAPGSGAPPRSPRRCRACRRRWPGPGRTRAARTAPPAADHQPARRADQPERDQPGGLAEPVGDRVVDVAERGWPGR